MTIVSVSNNPVPVAKYAPLAARTMAGLDNQESPQQRQELPANAADERIRRARISMERKLRSTLMTLQPKPQRSIWMAAIIPGTPIMVGMPMTSQSSQR